MGGKTVVDVYESDVLLGRGKRSNNWPGNIRFRKLVDAQQNAYMNGSDDVTRDAIAYEIANTIERQGGRFLRETVIEVDGAPRSAWVVVEGATIRTKVKQALRDSAKAKARESSNRDEPTTATASSESGRKSRSQKPQDSAGVALPPDRTSTKGPTKRSSAATSLYADDQQQEDRKRPAVAVPSHLDPLLGFGLSESRQQHQQAWGFPARPPTDDLFGHRTAEHQLRAAIEREQQLSLIRSLTSGQQQHLLRLEEERRSLAAALSLRRAAGLLPGSLDQLPYRFPPAPPATSTYNPMDQFRWASDPSPTDALAALQRLRQGMSIDPSAAAAARQSLLTGGQFDPLGGSQTPHASLLSGLVGDPSASQQFTPQQQITFPPSKATPRKTTIEDKKTSVASLLEQKREKSNDDGDDNDDSSEEDPEYDPEAEA